MPLLEPTDIQDALNIDLIDPEGQDLAETLIASATTWLSTILGYPIEQTEDVTSYFDGEYPRIWLPTGAPVRYLVLAAYTTTTSSYDSIEITYVCNVGDSRAGHTEGLVELPERDPDHRMKRRPSRTLRSSSRILAKVAAARRVDASPCGLRRRSGR
jgi:hypothetical protein